MKWVLLQYASSIGSGEGIVASGRYKEARQQFFRAKQIDGDLEAASASAQLIAGQRDEDG